jgi:hypothetical protein
MRASGVERIERSLQSERPTPVGGLPGVAPTIPAMASEARFIASTPPARRHAMDMSAAGYNDDRE